MIRAKRLWQAVLMAGAASTFGASLAQAQVSGERPGSLLIFPKVINASNTTIQITNTSNSTIYAHCNYINGATVSGRQLWQITDFNLTLTRQQPTYWDVATGRPTNPQDSILGLDPGPIPPVPDGFTGQLVCVEVDASGVPIDGDHLIGLATVAQEAGDDPASGIAKYNAIAIPAAPVGGTDLDIPGNGLGPDNLPSTAFELELDNDEYSACPAGYELSFLAQGSDDDVLLGLGLAAATNNTALTFIPCDANIESVVPGRATVSIQVTNVFEERLSGPATTVECWRTVNLDELPGASGPLTASGLGSTYGHARISVTSGNGVLMVAHRFTISSNGTSTSAVNPHMFGNAVDSNLDTPGATIRIAPH